MASSERVNRHRAKQAANERVRVELYLDRSVLEVVDRYANDLEESRASALRSLVLIGLRAELRMPVPEWFTERIRKRFR